MLLEKEQAQQLAHLAAEGDEVAFSRLVDAHQNAVYSVALGFFKNREDALDAAQETFLKAWRSIDSFRGDSAFSTWILKIAYNVCLDTVRKKKRHDAVSLTVEDDDGETRELDITDEQISASPERSAERRETVLLVRRAIDTLPYDQRTVLILRDMEDCTYEEIARILNLDLGTVKSRINRARTKLKKVLETWNFSP